MRRGSEPGADLPDGGASAEEGYDAGAPHRVTVDAGLLVDPGAGQGGGHQHRADPGAPSSPLRAKARPSGSATAEQYSAPASPIAPGSAVSSARSSRVEPETMAGCRRIAVATRAARRRGTRRRSAPGEQAEGPGQAGQRGRQGGRPAAVDGDRGRLPGELGDGAGIARCRGWSGSR